MKRREFLKLGGAGLLAAGSVPFTSQTGNAAVECVAPLADSTFRLAITDKVVELIDGEKVNALAFKSLSSSGSSRVPGPVLRVVEGDVVSISITNDRPEPHGFEVGGIPESKLVIAPGQTCRVTFMAPVAGTYLYHDASHPSRHLYRLLGLHGAFIVHPRDGWSRHSAADRCMTPYSLGEMQAASPLAVSRVSMLFEALGSSPRFAGSKWAPCALDQEYSVQEKIWLFNEIDPRFNALVLPDRIVASSLTASAASVLANFVPRYFTINGRSGYDLSDGEDVVVKNYIGEPTLLRTLNAGLCHHATHIHGNHIIELAHSILTDDGVVPLMGAGLAGAPGQVVLHDNIWERDTWPTWPMQIRDVLLPLEVPPDIPGWQKHATMQANEKFPLRYVMHDHCEMATTAAGGNYPQGAVTHWEILGPAGGRGRV
ncbi:MAG: multicopper oxidase domain-containing protein [Hyphomicrobiaceae bacterium]|nr:multicopper oxidase domain-containing protein [Hyphomicrobiaceae bacterium]